MAVTAIEPQGCAEDAALEALGVVAATRAGLDARLVEAARLVVAVTGAAVLAQKGFTSVEELSQGQRTKWRAETKRAACAEVQARLGMGVTEARQLVGLACAPDGVRTLVLGALDRAEVTWEMVRSFWRRCGSLEADKALLVAEGLFGTDPAVVVTERLTPEGDLRERPWHQADYTTALAREAARAEGEDAQAERERRRKAYRARRATITVHDDGTATLEATGPAICIIAAHSRIERAARLLRKQGDPRTLDQLRCDVLMALLVHGQLPVPQDRPLGSDPGPAAPGGNEASPDGPGGPGGQVESDPGSNQSPGDGVAGPPEGWADLLTPDLQGIARVVSGMPTIELQVIVPWDTLTGRPACPSCNATAHADPDQGENSAFADPSGRGRGVGLVLGRHPTFLSPGHLRELALAPGTTLARLLTDPADGRLVERSITAYRPDAAMRRQVLAADVYSRAPGTRQPGAVCELDHVTPWAPDGPGGPTAETNLVALAKSPHQLKTLGRALARINDLRDLTWTTLLGQTETTRVHDYRQYSAAPDLAEALDHAVPLDPARTHEHPALRQDLDARRDLLNRAFYAAIAHRGPGAFLTDADDHPGTGEHGGPLSGWMWVTRTHSGRRRDGADPHTPTPETVLGLATTDEPEPDPGDTDEPGTTGWRTPSGEPPPF
ncbi:protein of unknown function DUF222 [Serinicoccus hydrothermalis]|uniref:HNH nuclease domain-containing protein n=1 Tax=Serinicoccus hydrothermalis TaxID=1758689 RepID=A0A1B1NGE3_9MICO|nr:HNH endonuclease signature motif containing protein [Serinicoccus hydrothermalis]ANS80471.1 protein of unknown function DUF222 [Serinicoccus hydrothermalis]